MRYLLMGYVNRALYIDYIALGIFPSWVEPECKHWFPPDNSRSEFTQRTSDRRTPSEEASLFSTPKLTLSIGHSQSGIGNIQ